MQRTSIDARLANAASYGEREMNLFLWKKDIKRLRKAGLTVTKKYPSERKGEFYCNINWKEDKVAGEGEDFTQLKYLIEIASKADA